VTDAVVWLEAYAGRAPAALLHEMTAALPEQAASVPVALAEAAMTLYAGVARGSGGRESALSLLAADALFTQAFQAQAQLDPRGLADLAAHYGAAGRLSEVAS
jgi:hypothetical protein